MTRAAWIMGPVAVLVAGLVLFIAFENDPADAWKPVAVARPDTATETIEPAESSDRALSMATGKNGTSARSEHTASESPLLAATAHSHVSNLGGRVTDNFGNGVPHAEVYLSDRRQLPLPWSDNVELENTLTLRVTCDATGRFDLPDVPAGTLFLGARADGFAVPQATVLEPSAREPVLLVLQPADELLGRVSDATGAPVTGAQLFALRPGAATRTLLAWRRPDATTGPGGEFHLATLPREACTLLVQSGAHPPRFVDGEELREGYIEISLASALDLAGRALAPAAIDLRIRAQSDGVDDPAQLVTHVFGWDDRPGPGVRATRPDEQGHFTLPGLPAGEEVTVQLWGRDDAATPLRRLAQTRVRVEHGAFAELRAEGWARLALRVRDDAGAALGEAVRIRTEPPGALKSQLVEEETRTLVLAAWQHATLVVEAPGHRAARRELPTLAPDEELAWEDLVLERVPEVRLLVVDSQSGEPVTGARVRTRSNTQVLRTHTDRSGRARLTPEPSHPTPLAIRVSATGYLAAEVEVSPGTEDVQVQLEPGLTLRVRLLDERRRPLAACRVLAISDERVLDRVPLAAALQNGQTNSDGELQLRGLTGGQLWLRAVSADLEHALSDWMPYYLDADEGAEEGLAELFNCKTAAEATAR